MYNPDNSRKYEQYYIFCAQVCIPGTSLCMISALYCPKHY